MLTFTGIVHRGGDPGLAWEKRAFRGLGTRSVPAGPGPAGEFYGPEWGAGELSARLSRRSTGASSGPNHALRTPLRTAASGKVFGPGHSTVKASEIKSEMVDRAATVATLASHSERVPPSPNFESYVPVEVRPSSTPSVEPIAVSVTPACSGITGTSRSAIDWAI